MNALHRKQELLDAVKRADLLLLESLLRDSGDVNSIYPNGKTLLIVAVESQQKEIAEFLVRAGANLNQRDFYDRTPLMYAADQEDISIAQLLLEAGADVSAKNKQGRTALMYAAYKDSLGMTEALLNAGADMHARDHNDRSALNYSVYKKGRKCHDHFVTRGAEVREPESKTRRAGFMDRIRNSISVDEFTELKTSPTWTCSHIFSYFILFLFLFGAQFVWGPLVWLFILVAAWRLLITFPSVLKLYPLGWEILPMRSRKLLVADSVDLRPARDIAARDDVEFVSLLMDLGSRELSSLHLAHPEKQSLQVKVSIFYSRILSTLLALSIFVLVVILFAPGLLPDRNINTIVTSLALPLWIWVVFRLEYILRRRRLRLVQKDRDRIAGEISNLLNADDYKKKDLPLDFGLYLRAFMTTDKLHIKGFDLETMLAYSIAPTLPLLALGKPGEHLGSGRIQTTDEHWREEILQLMDAARLILIIPSHRGGTLWEISTLRERSYFEKTIFIMPPELEFHGGKYSSDWQKTITAAQEVGVEFPHHIPAGAFFRLSGNGEFEDYAPFVPEEFLLEFDPMGAGGGQSPDYNDSNTDGDNADSPDSPDGMDGGDSDGGMDSDGGDGGLGPDGVDSGGDSGGSGGDGGGDGGGGNGGGGDGGGGGH